MKQVGRTLRIWYVGGGTGGHIFPLFAVERQVRALCAARNIACTGLLITGRTARERSWVADHPIAAYPHPWRKTEEVCLDQEYYGSRPYSRGNARVTAPFPVQAP